MMAIVVLSATRIYARNIPKHRAVGFHCRWEPALPEIDSQALTTSYYTGLLTRSVAGQGLSKKFWRGANHCKAKRLQNHSTFDFCASHRLPGNILIGDLGYKIYSTCHFMSLLLFRQKLVSWQHHPDISRPCHGFWSHSSHQDFNSTDFRCCSLGLDQDTPCFHRLLGELKYRFWVLYGSMMCHMDLGETGYTIDIYIFKDIQRCLRRNAKQGRRLILAHCLQGRCCGKHSNYLKINIKLELKGQSTQSVGQLKNLWCERTPNPKFNKSWQNLKLSLPMTLAAARDNF